MSCLEECRQYRRIFSHPIPAILLALLFILFGAKDYTKAQFWPLSGGRLASYEGKWLSPVSNGVISSDENDHLARGSVNAWDLTVPFGTPVYPMAAGSVTYAGCNNAGGYGCWAFIDHGDGYKSVYAHLIDEGGGTIWVNSGDKVGPWTALGRVGWTGQTSFGPHVHWEIHHPSQGRLRIEREFNRGHLAYCKFCAASKDGAGGLGQVVYSQRVPYYTSLIGSRQFWAILLCLILLAAAFARPDLSVKTARQVGVFFLRTFHASNETVYSFRQSHAWSWTSIALVILIPLGLCSSTVAVSVWMSDEGIQPWQLMGYVRWGFLPKGGSGYQSGVQYSAVWGTPCRQVGTLGRTCTVDEILAAGIEWQEDVQRFTGTRPKLAVIPRIGGRFGYNKTKQLLYAAHQQDGLVIVDTAGDLRRARDAIDELVDFGLDGVAIDLEFMDNVTISDIRNLAEYLARQRARAGLQGEGVLVVWDVFHNLDNDYSLNNYLDYRQWFTVQGTKIIPIFTGYGSTVTKIAGLKATQMLFNVMPEESGMMAFDKRWPVNSRCQKFGTESGFDCQHWYRLFSERETRNVGWWVQQ